MTTPTNNNLINVNVEAMTYNLDTAVSGSITLTPGTNQDLLFVPSGSGTVQINSQNIATEAYADILSTSYTRTSVNNAVTPYSVLVADDVISVDCSGGVVELQLPAISALTDNKKKYTIVDETGNADTNNITVKPDSASGDFLLSETFASGGLIMNTAFESMVIYADESSRWLIIG